MELQQWHSDTQPPPSKLRPGDPIFHPRYGFGTLQSLTRRDRSRPIDEPSVADLGSDQVEDYYEIHLSQGGTLLVPVQQAESVGLRRLSVGIEVVKNCLRSPAESLPSDYRERAAVLQARQQLAEPTALAYCVRDVLAQSRGRTLSKGERAWLDKSCQRLVAEAALVDRTTVLEAQAAFREAVNQLDLGQVIP
jgi:RNA polymerase-interacting CarD/CdnL/TRCF family regulator